MNLNFSVLLSIYNKENPSFLNKALQSILEKQTLKPNEIIIVKDGLLTNSLHLILKKFSTKYPDTVKIFGYKENRGLGYALNYGLSFCSNELIFRMDGDDISIPERFKVQMDFLSKNPEISILGSTIKEFNENVDDLNRLRKVPISSIEIDKRKLNRNPFNHMTVCFKKSHIKKAGGYSHMPGYEDYYLWLRVLNFYKGHNIDKPLVFARVGNNMLGRRQGFRFFINEIRFQKTIYFDGIQSFLSFITNVILRGLPRLLPKFMLKIIYKYFLRN